MSLIDWKDDLSVQIVEIDNQHKKLLNLINELHDAMKTGKAKDVLESIIQKLISYTKSHFATEEKYFKQFNYPLTNEHIKEHNDFVNNVSDFQEKFKAGKLGLSIEIMKFLTTWISKHIQETDKAYSEFFIENGVK
ncbi:MAG: bacteriohemerythrin [Bacteroidetes bacterium]|nr:bacteriohemerythrin [Bacteroidota bacterium]